MEKWTEDDLIRDGYDIENALITNVSLSTENRGFLTLSLTLEGRGWGVIYGANRCIATSNRPSPFGAMYIMKIMDLVECERLEGLKGKYVRVATKGWGSEVSIIGNIIKDKWFDMESFWEDCK